MFDGLKNLFKRKDGKKDSTSKDTAKERLHLVLMQDRANVSADFLDMMRKEIIEVIKKYIDVDEKDIDVRLTNKPNEDGTLGAPALYANIPIAGVKEDFKTAEAPANGKETKKEDISKDNKKEEVKGKVKSENQEKTEKKEVEKLSNEEKVEVSDEKVEKESKEEETKKKEEPKKEEVKKEEKKKESEKKENNSSK